MGGPGLLGKGEVPTGRAGLDGRVGGARSDPSRWQGSRRGTHMLWEAGWWVPRVGSGLGAWLLTADITVSKGRMGARRSVGQV